jgi:hypothetical protein
MAKQNQHRPQKGEVKFYGATFKLTDPSARTFVRGEPKPKPSPTRKENDHGR